ncbi:MAG: alr0857 family protein [Cyanobacteria bacterium P01_G01_bin.49]
MLKLTYTDNGFYLNYLHQSLEGWVTTRVMLALRSGTSLCVEPSTAAFLVPVDLPYLDELLKIADTEIGEILEITRCDEHSWEIVLQGTWLASDIASEEGLFVCRLSDRAEFFLDKLWQETQLSTSVIE